MSKKRLREELQNYIVKYYVVPCIVIIALCMIELIVTGVISLKSYGFSIGLAVLLFAGIVLATFAIIAMVATYRELSRFYNKETKKAIFDKIEELEAKLNKLENK